jgi:hypothetical protein
VADTNHDCLWLPRGSSGTIEVTYDGLAGEYAYTTDDEAPPASPPCS